jgi:hypothetical protein
VSWKALTERLGVSGAIGFLMEYDPGRGDYVEERRELFRELSLDEIIVRARERSARGDHGTSDRREE